MTETTHTPLTKATAHRGMEVLCNGHRGFIRTIYNDDKLDGMVDVDMARGSVCVHVSDLAKWGEG